MGDEADISQHVRLAAEQQGLGKALRLFPETMKAAAERGLKPLGDHPGVSPTGAPAPMFDPARFEDQP
jgi:hypothetical protein